MFSTPLLSVTEDEGHPLHDPCSSNETIPVSSENPLKAISPPSSCTAGLMRVSKSSLIIATTSVSSSSIAVSDVSSALS
eukprot:CAMPEP_0197860282 /NCGR_PEP_ID=MMETSP1438-20131217/35541_1 /TAXON_ID=1461541 /ORGANISM="Pterosperma sp., Strain CCMP1384" /LENGTH=78 /DNA_ID=CAMNT_0043477083 /DNA_START=67 /DNA_END=300 /DNA_ORIENTATION=+